MDEPASRIRRLFVGIELDTIARAACAQIADRLRHTGYRACYDDAGKYHLTLAFLGNVEHDRVADVEAVLPAIARNRDRFLLRFDRLDAFPHERRPRIVFVGAREQGAAYRALSRDVRTAYEALGFTSNGDAVAHVTIARIKGGGKPLPLVDAPPFECQVDALALFESLFDRRANTTYYQIRRTASLG